MEDIHKDLLQGPIIDGSNLEIEESAKTKYFNSCLVLGPDNSQNLLESSCNTSTLIEYARRRIDLQDYKGALVYLERANDLDPKCAVTLEYLGEVKRNLEDFSGALEKFNCANLLKGDQSSILSLRGVVQRELHNYRAALEDLDKANDLDPDNAFIHQQRGVVKRLMNDFKGALEDLDKANNLMPKNAFTLTQRGVVKKEVRDFEGALQDLNDANTLNPTDAFNLRQRGSVNKSLMKYKEALVDLNKANEIHPNHGYTLGVRGITKKELHDFEGALEDFNKANELDANDVFVCERGVTKKALEDFGGALEDFDLANSINPKNAFILKQRGAVRREMKDFEGALKDLDMANNLEPFDAYCLVERGMTKKELDDLTGALADYNMANELDPTNSFILRQRGSLRRLLKDYNGALKDLNAADENQPNNAHILKERSRVKLELRDYFGAREDSSKSFRLGSNHEFSFKHGPQRLPIQSSIHVNPRTPDKKKVKTCVPSALWIDHKELISQKILGRGSYGHVHQCKWKNQIVAVKYLETSPNSQELFEHEATMLATLQHPRVVRLLGCGFDKENNGGILVMELMTNNLRNTLNHHKLKEGCSFSLDVAVDIMTKIAEGMEFLHGEMVLHRDLKSNNILVSPSDNGFYDVKIADFGVSKCNPFASKFYSMQVGTTLWKAPETFKAVSCGQYSWAADVWSFSITCYEILSGELPYHNEEISFEDFGKKLQLGLRPKLDPSFCPPVLSSLLQKCWSLNPQTRPKFSKICKVLRLYRNLILEDLSCDFRTGDVFYMK